MRSSIMRFFKERHGYSMPFFAIVLATLAVPLMVLSIDVPRFFYLQSHLQSATDASCEAAARALDLPHFKSTGQPRIDLATGRSYASREFNGTLSENGIVDYDPSLNGVRLLAPATVECSASAQFYPTFYGRTVTVRATSVSDMRVSRR